MDRPSQNWYERAARLMVREGHSLFGSAMRIDVAITQSEAKDIERSIDFQRVLRTERNRVYKELAEDPARSRNTAVGQLLFIVDRMFEKELWDKAAGVILQLAKLEGWLSEGANINIFQDLSAKDLKVLRDKFQSQLPVTTHQA